VELDGPEEVAAVRERVFTAEVGVEKREGGGFLVRDPWGIAVLFVTSHTLAT
jgi:hypothetical protein